MSNPKDPKKALDKIIKKARVHLYKPIQIAEILFRDRTIKDIDLATLETYRTKSRKWRDIICIQFLGRTSTSSARYQDDLFNDNAIPPSILAHLGQLNRASYGGVERYIYQKFQERYEQMNQGLRYVQEQTSQSFQLETFLNLFWNTPGLKRSIDKIYEIIVYALFDALIQELNLTIEVNIDPQKMTTLQDFNDFTQKVAGISEVQTSYKTLAKIFRVGVTNAADRGLDMWANFGPAIQIKHLSLDEKRAKEIVNTLTSNRIVIVCKDAEKELIQSFIQQIGWTTQIQSIITEDDLKNWYQKAFNDPYTNSIGKIILQTLREEILLEFPASDNTNFKELFAKREYQNAMVPNW